jgi:ribosomal-protein-alanine N-acetyltransferase
MFTLFNAFMKGYFSDIDITILPATKSDLPVLSKIHAASFRHGWSDGDLEKMLSNKTYTSFVAHPPKTRNSKPLGFVFVRVIADEAEIITIATSPQARRKGVGSQLMRSVIRWLEYDRCKKLFLEVDETNNAAISLYRQLGFKPIGERVGYYENKANEKSTRSAALVMQLELG